MSSSPKKEAILLIEGNKNLAEKLSKELKADGYIVFVNNDGTTGLKTISETVPKLLILDLNIEDMDAYDFLTKIHSDATLSKIPVFLLSSEGTPINMRKVPEGGVKDYIVALDPDPVAVLSNVNNLFGHTSTPQDLNLKDDGSAKNSKKILWVEDDKLISTILKKKFATSGISVIQTTNGEEALRKLKVFVPDLIILDITLPGMDGFEILQKVHMDERLQGVPTLILSNLSRASDFEKAKKLGATKYMIKASSSLDQIVTEVKALMN